MAVGSLGLYEMMSRPKGTPQRVQVSIWHIHKHHSKDIAALSRPRYVPYWYVDLLSFGFMSSGVVLTTFVPTSVAFAKGSMQAHGMHLGLQGAPISLLWGLCMYHNDTWTLWETF